MITVRRATIDDKPEIFRFIKSAYEGRWQYKIPDRWEWEFINNPFLGDQQLPIFIAVDSANNVVGQTCAMFGQIKIGSELFRFCWGVDFYVLPKYRGQGIGFKLLKANHEAHSITMNLSMAEYVRRMKIALGSVPLEPVPYYRKYLKYTPQIMRNAVLERLAKDNRIVKHCVSIACRCLYLDRLLAFIKNAHCYIKDRQLFNKRDKRLRFISVETFPIAINGLWEKISPQFYAIAKRDCEYLNWKFVRQPHVRYARIIAQKGEQIYGYIILRKGMPPERNIGIIADIFVDPGDEGAVGALLAYAMQYFRKQKVVEIVSATSVKEYQCCLTNMDFKKMGEEHPVISVAKGNHTIETHGNYEKWFFSQGDHDWDQYPLVQ